MKEDCNKTIISEPPTIRVNVFSVRSDEATLEGVVSLSEGREIHALIAKDERGEKYTATLLSANDGVGGTFINQPSYGGVIFRVSFPVHRKTEIGLYLTMDRQSIKIAPAFDGYIGLNKKVPFQYCIKGEYLVRLRNNSLYFIKNTVASRALAEFKYSKARISRMGLPWVKRRLEEIRLLHIIQKKTIKNQVAFISVRSDDHLMRNMEKVYEQLDLPKVKLTKIQMHKYPEFVKLATELVYSSKVVVTDDYLFLFRNNDKKQGQYYVQLWHAAGAIKHFGCDASPFIPAKDALYHRDYDLVTVASDYNRYIFASAFRIPIDKVRATGIARTDDFFDTSYIEKKKAEVFLRHPELEGKQIILYTPTFRDLPGIPRNSFSPDLDFEELSKLLDKDQRFVLCPHPIMTDTIIKKKYDNIIEVRDVTTNDMMFVADLLITDYSSTIFEYSLLRKPMVFYCYDYYSYERPIHIDFDRDLSGMMLRTQEELFSFLKRKEFRLLDDFDDFYEKYMGACDGHSTDRIVKYIEDMYYDCYNYNN